MKKRRMTDKELAEEAARWAATSVDKREWVDAPERVPRVGETVPISVRIPKRMLVILREFARRNGLGYQVLLKRWLDDRIRQEYEALSTGTTARSDGRAPQIEISSGATVRFLDASQGAFAHLYVVNKGPFAPRVRCWLRFEKLDGTPLFASEMPARWSCAPEPIRQLAIPRPDRVDLVFVPDPSLLPVQGIADFATLEGHPIPVAVKLADGTCWGFTPESYFHQFRHPAWKLPAERLRVSARILANGRTTTKSFELDGSAPLRDFAVREADRAKHERDAPRESNETAAPLTLPVHPDDLRLH